MLIGYFIQGDTIFFVRSVEPPPPYELPSSEKAPDKPETRCIETVFFKNIEGRSMNLTKLPITMTIAEVKARLAAEKDVENDETVRYIWGGKTLDDSEKFAARTLMPKYSGADCVLSR